MSEIHLEVTDGVAVVTLDAPERRNALSPEMAAELVATIDAIDADPEVGSLLLQARGQSFCAGGHRSTLDDAGDDPSADGSWKDIGAIYESFFRVGHAAVPSVAAVRGAAVGAGVNLVMATDLRVMATDAKLLSGFGRLRLHPGGGHFSLLNRQGARETAAAMGLFHEELDGTRAAEVGLAWIATAEDEVEPTAMKLARRAAKDPELARAIVRSFRLEAGPPALSWEAALQSERASQMWSFRRRAMLGAGG
jgi:enoyl-CoA hydratase